MENDERSSHTDIPKTPREDFEDWYAHFTPDDDEIEAWARRERTRRERWVSGPTDEEKREWARRRRWERMMRSRARPPHYVPDPYDAEDCPPPASSGPYDNPADNREFELAMKGMWHTFWNWPGWAWQNMVRSGRQWERRAYTPSRPSRIAYDCEDY